MVKSVVYLPQAALEELRRESAERQRTLQGEIDRLKLEKEEVFTTAEAYHLVKTSSKISLTYLGPTGLQNSRIFFECARSSNEGSGTSVKKTESETEDPRFRRETETV